MGKKIIYNEVKEYIEKNSKCKLLSLEYKNAKTKLLLLCECGNEFETIFGNFKSNNKKQCNNCGRKKMSFINTKTHECFMDEIYKKYKNEYIILCNYKNTNNKIKVKHNVCGYVYNVAPCSLLYGYNCPKCAGNMKKQLNNLN
jgi:predicted nucleic acid-binding Zn ribbon protein